MAATETFPRSRAIFRFAASIRLWLDGLKQRPEPDDDDEARARRDFVLEMMDVCPEAFASEAAVSGSILYFSRRF